MEGIFITIYDLPLDVLKLILDILPDIRHARVCTAMDLIVRSHSDWVSFWNLYPATSHSVYSFGLPKMLDLIQNLNMHREHGFLKCCAAGNVRMVQFIMESIGVHPIWEQKGLISAVRTGNLELVRALTAQPWASLDEPHHEAVKYGHIEVAKYLMSLGPSIGISTAG